MVCTASTKALLLVLCVTVSANSNANENSCSENHGTCPDPNNDTISGQDSAIKGENAETNSQDPADSTPDLLRLFSQYQQASSQNGGEEKVDILSLLRKATSSKDGDKPMDMLGKLAPMITQFLEQNKHALEKAPQDVQQKAKLLMNVLPWVSAFQSFLPDINTLMPLVSTFGKLFGTFGSPSNTPGVCPSPTWQSVLLS